MNLDEVVGEIIQGHRSGMVMKVAHYRTLDSTNPKRSLSWSGENPPPQAPEMGAADAISIYLT
jgi:hypothetical protein